MPGSEAIELLDNRRVACWKLVHHGQQPNGTPFNQTFWISRKRHEFLKEEDAFSGLYRYKIKLPATAPDLLPRFH